MILSYAEVVSTIALFSSIFSIWLYWRRDKQERLDREPEVTCEISPAVGLFGWTKLTITIRNRDNIGLKANNLRVIWPIGSRLASYWDSVKDDPRGGWHGDILHEPAKTYRIMQMNLTLAHAGAKSIALAGSSPIMGTGDTHSEAFLISGCLNSRPILCMSMSSSLRSRKVLNSIIRAQIVADEHTKRTHEKTIN